MMKEKMMKDKVCIITGAASGIGLAISERFAKEGAKVVMGDINGEKLKTEAERLGATPFKADLTKRQECKNLVDFTISKFSKVDVLVNDAGIQYVAPIEEFPEEKWDFIISLMLTAPFLLTKYVWPSMKNQKWGRIINIDSAHGLRASAFKAAYVSAKHGLAGLTKVAGIEGASYGITVNSICPSYVRTPLVEGQIAAQAKAHRIPIKEVTEKIILHKNAIKKLIEPSAVAELALYLCSDAAQYITGSMLPIDCGWTAQ